VVAVAVFVATAHGSVASRKLLNTEVEELSDLESQPAGDGMLLGEGAGAAAATLLTSEVKEEEVATVNEAAAASGTCGDGKREGTEECDDGNTAANDGCTALCKVEGGYQCLPLEMNGKDLCVACKDSQCTTMFSRQSRCLDTATALIKPKQDTKPKEQSTPEMSLSDETQNVEEFLQESSGLSLPTSPDMKLLVDTFVQESAGLQGAYARAGSGFCDCAPNFCKLAQGTDSSAFTCKSTAKGWARKSLTDASCTCAPGFCSMPLAGTVPEQFHCTPLHSNMIRNNSTGVCECRGAIAGVASTDPSKAVPAQKAACQILPTEPVLSLPGGGDKFGKFQCVGAPYDKDPASVKCKGCEATACKMDRSIGTDNFLCFAVTNGTAGKSAPYTKKPDGKCECGADQCLKPNGDHSVCRDLNSAKPYGPVKHSDGQCGCSADSNVCKLTIKGGYRCVHVSQDNFARKYRRGADGSCECKANMCIGKPHPDNGALTCENAFQDAPYMRKAGTFECACKPGACQFPNGVCKQCPSVPGHCEAHCFNATATETECVKFCRTKNIVQKMVRATAQGQLQSVKKTVAREVGCFVQKVTKCTITDSSKKCTQKKSAKALYDCPAAKSGQTPLRLNDGTETFGYASVCGDKDLECQIQKCGRNPDSTNCLESSMLA
jgi:cysteine-rich repeat protein